MNRMARTQRAEKHAGAAAPPSLPPSATAPDSTWEAGVSLTGYDLLGAARQFHEPVRGLRIRELLAPGLFRRFFSA